MGLTATHPAISEGIMDEDWYEDALNNEWDSEDLVDDDQELDEFFPDYD